MTRKKIEPTWRCVSVTMLQGNRDRLRDALRIRGMALGGLTMDATSTQITAYINTTRTAREIEDALRAQLQFSGWMAVEEEE